MTFAGTGKTFSLAGGIEGTGLDDDFGGGVGIGFEVSLLAFVGFGGGDCLFVFGLFSDSFLDV